MIMAKRRKRQSVSIPLPWEQRAAALRGVLAGSRFRLGLLLLMIASTVWVVYRASDAERRTRQTRAAIDEVHRAIGGFRAEVADSLWDSLLDSLDSSWTRSFSKKLSAGACALGLTAASAACSCAGGCGCRCLAKNP